MGFLDDLLGNSDPGAARKKRIDDDTFKRAVLREAAAFSAMSRAGLDIGPRGRGVIAQAKRMGLVTPLSKGLPRNVQGVPVRGQERTKQILEQLSDLLGGRVRTPQQAFGAIPRLPSNVPDMRLGGIEPPSGGLRRTRIGEGRKLFQGQDKDINDLLGFGFDEDFLE